MMRTVSRSRRPLCRRGTTLIQMVVVMTVTSSLLLIAGGLIHLLLRTEGQAMSHLRVSLARGHLAAAFREDVHTANSSEVGDNGGSLLLKQGDRKIHWTIEPRRLVRLVRGGEEDIVIYRETYAVEAAKGAFVLSTEPRRTITLQLESDSQQGGGTKRVPLSIAAIEGREASSPAMEKTP